jgi:hypothetical protein
MNIMALVLQTLDVNGTTYAKVKDGKPLYIEDTNNTEQTWDPEENKKSLATLRKEAQTHRERAEKAAADLKAFEGLDPEAAREALQTVENLSSKDLIAADKVDEIKQGVEKATEKKFQGQIDQLTQARDKALNDFNETNTKFHRAMLTNAFATSKFIADKLSLPPPAVQDIFSRHFKIEEDRIVAVDDHGAPIYSLKDPSKTPDFDEALSIVISNYPYRDNIMKGRQQTGGSGDGGHGGGKHGEKSMSRPEFDRMAVENPAEAQKRMREGWKVYDINPDQRNAA